MNINNIQRKEKEVRIKHVKEVTDLRQKYDDMLTKVRAWIPPTSEHDNLKNFMIKQIEESIEWDCNIYFSPQDMPKKLTVKQWRASKIESCMNDIKYHSEQYAEEAERISGNNKWVRQLRESLKGV